MLKLPEMAASILIKELKNRDASHIAIALKTTIIKRRIRSERRIQI